MALRKINVYTKVRIILNKIKFEMDFCKQDDNIPNDNVHSGTYQLPGKYVDSSW